MSDWTKWSKCSYCLSVTEKLTRSPLKICREWFKPLDIDKKCAHCGAQTDGAHGVVGPRATMIPLCKGCHDKFCQTQDGINGSTTFRDCDYVDASAEVQMPDGSWKKVPLIPKNLDGTLEEFRITKGKSEERMVKKHGKRS